MDLFIFARFHAGAGQENAIAITLREQVAAVRNEPGCMMIAAYRSIRDRQQFWIHARWTDEAAFERHADAPLTQRFIARMESLTDQPPDVTRTQAIG